MEKIKIYMAGSLISEPVLTKITESLRTNQQLQVYYPLEIDSLSNDINHSIIPVEVANQCRNWIIDSDIILINLENFGRDTSWEVGFSDGLGKKKIGFLISNLRILEDWMVKTSIEGLICLNTIDNILRVIENDPFFAEIERNIDCITKFEDLPDKVLEINSRI